DSDELGCLLCWWAVEDCDAPTPDCKAGWAENLREGRCGCQGDCAMGMRCYEESGNCDPACVSDAGCPGGVCHPEAQVCVECYEDSQCDDKRGPRCLAGRCHECRVREDCPSFEPHCVAGTCRRCISSLECTDPLAPHCNGQ